MQTTQLALETVTPMFLHGHDNRIVELRPPPFKALFRYWWRAVQDCDWKGLQKEEANLFGSTKGKAPFAIRIPGTTDLRPTKTYSALPHKGTARMDAYDVDKTFKLCMITKDKSDARCYKQIAKLGFLLGGIGNRSRRGFGSIRDTGWQFTDVFDLQDKIWATLNTVTGAGRFRINDNFLMNNKRIQIIELPRFTNYPPEYPVIRRIFFGQTPCSTVVSLLTKIGEMTHKHYTRRNHALGYAERNGRFASPIHVRIQKVNADYFPIVTQFYPIYPEATPRDIQSKNLFQRQKDFIGDIIE